MIVQPLPIQPYCATLNCGKCYQCEKWLKRELAIADRLEKALKCEFLDDMENKIEELIAELKGGEK